MGTKSIGQLWGSCPKERPMVSAGSTPISEPGYVEPPRSTGNRNFTDYQEDQKAVENGRMSVFRDRRR